MSDLKFDFSDIKTLDLSSLDDVESQQHRECVKLAWKGSVPHGGVDWKDVPLAMVPYFDELIKKGLLVVKKNRNGPTVVTTTRRSMFILSMPEYVECVRHVDKAWKDYERDTNVRNLILGPFARPEKGKNK